MSPEPAWMFALLPLADKTALAVGDREEARLAGTDVTFVNKAAWYLDQLRANMMQVLPPSPALAAGFRQIGEQLAADWLQRAGGDGQAVTDAYRKM